MPEENLVKLIEAQIKVEENFVSAVNDQKRDLHNVAARLLLLETRKDSEKHALIL